MKIENILCNVKSWKISDINGVSVSIRVQDMCIHTSNSIPRAQKTFNIHTTSQSIYLHNDPYVNVECLYVLCMYVYIYLHSVQHTVNFNSTWNFRAFPWIYIDTMYICKYFIDCKHRVTSPSRRWTIIKEFFYPINISNLS